MAIDATEREALRDALLRARARGTTACCGRAREAQGPYRWAAKRSNTNPMPILPPQSLTLRRASTARPTSVLFSSSKGL
jgi:uncharacterized protein YggE